MEKSHYELRKGTFSVHALEGEARAVGAQLARGLAETRPELIERFAGKGFAAKQGRAEREETDAMLEKSCPGILEEIEGFAEEAGRRPEDIAFAFISRLKGAACSQAVLPAAHCVDGQARVLRSYEWTPGDDDLSLCVTRKAGKKAHIGCSLGLFGRMDGLNEDGLSVTMSGGMAAGLPEEWKYREGLNFWVVVRGMLENCARAEEALGFLAERVPAGNTIFLIADASGRALRAEVLKGLLHARKAESPEEVLVATNHYEMEATRGANHIPFIMEGSVPRLANLKAFLAQKRGSIADGDLREILGRPVPSGCFGPYYDQGFGTLWASIFRPAEAKADYCFGAPGFNPWRSFGFYEACGSRNYDAVFPQMKMGM